MQPENQAIKLYMHMGYFVIGILVKIFIDRMRGMIEY
jgi:hypothetical protein